MASNSDSFIPVIDLFAGAGGLGEGFNAFTDDEGRRPFRTVLSIEQNPQACETLKLRAFYWQHKRANKELPEKEYLSSTTTKDGLERLFATNLEFEEAANREVLKETLDIKNSDAVHEQIKEALGNNGDNWVLVGGPPCQAFSLAGRVRSGYTDGIPDEDHRPRLYEIYLRILDELEPPIFLMENVDSLISAKLLRSESDEHEGGGTAPIFAMPLILKHFCEKGYRLHSLTQDTIQPYSKAAPPPDEDTIAQPPPELSTEETARQLRRNQERYLDNFRRFVVRSEEYGIPQKRHRVIVLGIHQDVGKDDFRHLERSPGPCTREVLQDLPRIRSNVTGNSKLTSEEWTDLIRRFQNDWWLTPTSLKCSQDAFDKLKKTTEQELNLVTSSDNSTRSENSTPLECFIDPFFPVEDPIDHNPRRHIIDDLRRYLFATYYAHLNKGHSPHLNDFPRELIPQWARIRIDSRVASDNINKDGKNHHRFTFNDPSNGWPKWAIATTPQVRLFLTEENKTSNQLPKFLSPPEKGFPVVSGQLVLTVNTNGASNLSQPDSVTLLSGDDKRTSVLSTRSESCTIKVHDENHHRFTFDDPSNGWPKWASTSMSKIRLLLTDKPHVSSTFRKERFQVDDARLIIKVQTDAVEIPPDRHANVTMINVDNTTAFKDAFYVQPAERPAATITCHAGKDGHKSIHHEPWQCRSLSVREVARIQTFPDNYSFCGTTTQKYTQVGNAVPPGLAKQLAKVVYSIFESRPGPARKSKKAV